jgi:hypothetical protein
VSNYLKNKKIEKNGKIEIFLNVIIVTFDFYLFIISIFNIIKVNIVSIVSIFIKYSNVLIY